MIIKRKGVLFILLVAACCLARAARAQEGITAESVRRAMEALEKAPRYERTEKRGELVEAGQVAITPLGDVVKGHGEAEDANYVGHCILALGELKAREATDVLIDALGSSNMQLAYWSANALGQIWEGLGASEPQARQVNAALLAVLYSDMPDTFAYGPGLALIKINNIGATRPESMGPEELRSVVDAWLASNMGSLPPADQQPWQLNLRAVLTSQDDATRQNALQALRQKRELGPVKPMLEVLGDEQSGSAPVRQALGQLLGELTGVPFPPVVQDSPADAASQVQAWRMQWFVELTKHTEPKYVAYCWRQLENSVREYAADPGETTARPIAYYRAALLHQVPDAEAIPATASPKAKELLTDPLETKKKIVDAVTGLEGNPAAYEKKPLLDVIEEELRDEEKTKYARDVAAMFLPRLARLAREERNADVADTYGDLLSMISRIPPGLDHPQLDVRQARLDQWLQNTGVKLAP